MRGPPAITKLSLFACSCGLPIVNKVANSGHASERMHTIRASNDEGNDSRCVFLFEWPQERSRCVQTGRGGDKDELCVTINGKEGARGIVFPFGRCLGGGSGHKWARGREDEGEPRQGSSGRGFQ